MPSRGWTILIFLFWATMTVWLVRRDVWPRLASGEPPLFALDLLDDSSTAAWSWTAVRTSQGRGHPIYYSLTTRIEHDPKQDVFTLKAEMLAKRKGLSDSQLLEAGSLRSSYQVTRQGHLLGFEARVAFRSGLLEAFGEQRGVFRGEIRERTCFLHGEVGNDRKTTNYRDEWPVAHNGQVLLPLHPVTRIPGLTPGRTWRIEMLDPFASTALLGSLVRWSVIGRVASENETLTISGRRRLCQIIEYEGEGGEVSGRTWVEADSGQVLRSQFRLGGENWDLTRD